MNTLTFFAALFFASEPVFSVDSFGPPLSAVPACPEPPKPCKVERGETFRMVFDSKSGVGA
jgi:hypothetical protein